jgi:hypothetical protein
LLQHFTANAQPEQVKAQVVDAAERDPAGDGGYEPRKKAESVEVDVQKNPLLPISAPSGGKVSQEI